MDGRPCKNILVAILSMLVTQCTYAGVRVCARACIHLCVILSLENAKYIPI